MGTKKHKKHKSEKKERYEEKQAAAGDKPMGLKLILKVGSSSTPEHSDSPGPPVNVNYSVAPPPADEESRHSIMSQHGEDKHGEKHKKAKKKKKKKEKEKDKERDKHEKKHKHHHKERRKRPREESSQDDVSIGEESLSEPPVTKKSAIDIKTEPDLPLREPRTCVLRQRQERNPLQKLLDYLLKGLEKKDPQQFFAWPVTDNIAPGYSQIIQHPMDFSTMKQKIDDSQYNTLTDFVVDFRQMCDNAMIYNHQETIYYKAAKKLLHVGLKMMSQEKLKPLQNVLTYMGDLTREELGFDLCDDAPMIKIEPETGDEETQDSKKEVRRKMRSPKPIGKFEAIPDDLTPEEILEQAQRAAQGAADRLSLRRPNSKISFLRQKKDGTTSLNILCPNEGVLPGTNEKPISLGAFTGKLTHGTGQLQGFREDRRNLAKAVKPLYYGAFGSYAPSYDSTFANLTKEESDLVYSTYGDETAVQYAESILDFAKDCDYTLHLVDNLLDIMTGKEHSKTMRILEERKRMREEEEKIKQLLEGQPEEKQQSSSSSDVKIDFDSLKTLTDIGIDVKFLESVEQQYRSAEAQRSAEEAMQTRLDQTSELLEKLQKVQRDRLSQNPPSHLSHVPQPSEAEVQLAEKITESLKDMAKKVNPEDIAPVPALRKAMGIGLGPSSPSSPVSSEEHDVASQDQQEPIEVDIEGTSSQAEETGDFESELHEFLENDPSLSTYPLQDDKTIEEIEEILSES